MKEFKGDSKNYLFDHVDIVLCAKCKDELTRDDIIYYDPDDTESEDLFCWICKR